MKKLFFLLLLLPALVFSQNFPGTNVELLIGKKLKVTPLKNTTLGYSNFYKSKDFDFKNKYALNKYYYSEYDSLIDRIFTVLSFEPYSSTIGDKKYKLAIENIDIGTIYFDYDPKWEHTFTFEVMGGLDLPKDFFCKDIEVNIDKFTDEKNYSAPFCDGVMFLKVETKNGTTYYAQFNTHGSTVSLGEKGIIILFKDGYKIERNDVEIDCDVSSSGSSYNYSAFFRLNSIEIEKFKNEVITDYRLYIYDNSITNGIKLQEYMKCLSN
jgi:hypothetical protein